MSNDISGFMRYCELHIQGLKDQANRASTRITEKDPVPAGPTTLIRYGVGGHLPAAVVSSLVHRTENAIHIRDIEDVRVLVRN